QPVVVIIQEACAKPARRKADLAEAQLVSSLIERAVAVVMPEGIGLLGKIGHENVRETMVFKVLRVNSHSATHLTVRIESTVGFERDFGESSVPIVAKQKVRR